MRWRLGRRYSQAAIDTAVGRLEEAGLIDDAKFVSYWVDQRETFSPRGCRALRAELAAKGVAAPLIDAALESIVGQEEELAYRVAAQKARRGAMPGGAADGGRLEGQLRRRGFRSGAIQSAIARLAESAVQV